MAITMTRWNPLAIKLVAAVLCSYFIFSLFLGDRDAYYSTRNLVQAGRHRISHDAHRDHIKNETLGFEKIYAIGLKERTDKHDFLTLAASVTGLDIEWVDGVKADLINEKSLPEGFNSSGQKLTVAACWRAHMNVLSKIIENHESTALILEDDADWDISLRQQMQEFATGVRTLTNNHHAPRNTPYGTNWDLLWVGGCASGSHPNETDIYAIPNDPTVPAIKNRNTWGGPPDAWKKKHPELPEDSTRYIYRAEMGCCTYGYAVTWAGARKLLAAMSVDYLDRPVDLAMKDMCRGDQDREQIECYAPFPNIIGTYKAAGIASRGSDIESYNDEYHEANAQNLVYSVRLNINRLIRGGLTVFSQWNSSYYPWSRGEIGIEGIEYPRGFLVR